MEPLFYDNPKIETEEHLFLKAVVKEDKAWSAHGWATH